MAEENIPARDAKVRASVALALTCTFHPYIAIASSASYGEKCASHGKQNANPRNHRAKGLQL
jgi:hypothetical protein